MGDEDVDLLTRNPGDNYVDGRMVGVGRAIPTSSSPATIHQQTSPAPSYPGSSWRRPWGGCTPCQSLRLRGDLGPV